MKERKGGGGYYREMTPSQLFKQVNNRSRMGLQWRSSRSVMRAATNRVALELDCDTYYACTV